MWNLKRNDTENLVIKQTHRLKRMNLWLQGVRMRECWGKGIVREFRIDLYTLPYLKWITNKDLLYSTWNSTQCYVPASWEGDLGENGYMYM